MSSCRARRRSGAPSCPICRSNGVAHQVEKKLRDSIARGRALHPGGAAVPSVALTALPYRGAPAIFDIASVCREHESAGRTVSGRRPPSMCPPSREGMAAARRSSEPAPRTTHATTKDPDSSSDPRRGSASASKIFDIKVLGATEREKPSRRRAPEAARARDRTPGVPSSHWRAQRFRMRLPLQRII